HRHSPPSSFSPCCLPFLLHCRHPPPAPPPFPTRRSSDLPYVSKTVDHLFRFSSRLSPRCLLRPCSLLSVRYYLRQILLAVKSRSAPRQTFRNTVLRSSWNRSHSVVYQSYHAACPSNRQVSGLATSSRL